MSFLHGDPSGLKISSNQFTFWLETIVVQCGGEVLLCDSVSHVSCVRACVCVFSLFFTKHSFKCREAAKEFAILQGSKTPAPLSDFLTFPAKLKFSLP